MDKVHLSGQMVGNMLDNGRKGNRVEEEVSQKRMDKAEKESGLMEEE